MRKSKREFERYISAESKSNQKLVKVKWVTLNPATFLNGIPRGSVLGLMLFVACMHDLPEVVKYYVYLFTDDAYLFTDDAYLFTGDAYLFTGDAHLFTDDAYLFTDDAYLFTDDAYLLTDDAYLFTNGTKIIRQITTKKETVQLQSDIDSLEEMYSIMATYVSPKKVSCFDVGKIL